MHVCAGQLKDGRLYMHGWVLILPYAWVLIHVWTGAYVCMDGGLRMHGRVVVHAWTGGCTRIDGCLYMHGRVLVHV